MADKEKLALLQYVNHDANFICLKDGKKTIKVNLRTTEGFLQGVGRTPKGEVLEFRYVPERKVPLTFRDGTSSRIFVTPRINIVSHGARESKEPFIRGDATTTLGHSRVDPDIRGLGVGKRMIEIATDAHASRLPRKKGTFFSMILRGTTASALAHMGWEGVTEKDKKELTRTIAERRDPKAGVWLKKHVSAIDYDNPQKWHKIRVLTPNGAPYALMVKVQQSPEESKMVAEMNRANRAFYREQKERMPPVRRRKDGLHLRQKGRVPKR